MNQERYNSAARVAEFRSQLKAASLKVTTARISVLSVLDQAEKPLTHADVQQALKEQSIDQSTIFRNLNDLADAGLVSKSELGDHAWRFELIRPGHEDGHPHFVCVDCGEVTCLTSADLQIGSQQVSGVGEISQILIKGHCQQCTTDKPGRD